jgi:NAD(P)-dependent dehydrogenase (short-subunit alcohol dehydrogenase family)
MTTANPKKAALITGGAKRIGASLAVKLAGEGYDIALHYNTSEAEAIETSSAVRAIGRECALFKGNLRDMNFIPELIRAAFDSFPHLSVLINSASVFRRAEIRNTSVQVFDELINVNYRAPFFLIREFAKFCSQGNIINILDTKISRYQNVYAAYIISRTALKELTAMAAVEFAPGIRSNCICPGLILPAESDDIEYVKKLESRNLLNRTGSPDDIGSAVMFILKNGFFTGQTIFVDGGENIK